MLYKSFRCWLILWVLGPSCALALEIGEIRVNSALNQLFDARIPLPKLAPEDLSKISVKLAPLPLFKEFGLERAAVLAKLVFSIEYNPEGQVYVKVVSTQPVREPSLGLLLEFGWPRGKTYREFTVFLDPVQRLAKRADDRTKTVLDAAPAAVASAEPAPVPAPGVPAAAPVAAAAVPAAAPAAAPAASASVAPTPAPASVPAQDPAVVAGAAVEPVPVPTPETSMPAPASVPPQVPTAIAGTAASEPPTVVEPAPMPTPASPVPTPPTVATVAVPEPVQPPISPPAAVDASPAPISVKAYKPGDSYGPVGTGEGLSKIALKVRPDPEITPYQMMQALYKANPNAFSKAGINGLKVGSVLRLPTLREIANFTGSAAAKRLAEAEKTPTVTVTDTVKPVAESSEGGLDRAESAQVGGNPQAFPLALPTPLEPMPVETAPLASLSESLQYALGFATVAPQTIEPELKAAAAEPKTDEKQLVRSSVDSSVESFKALAAPVAMATPAKRPMAGATVNPIGVTPAVAQPLLEPVPATPLLFLATSDVMASVLRVPAFTIPAQIAPEAIIAQVPVLAEANEASSGIHSGVGAKPQPVPTGKAPEPGAKTVPVATIEQAVPLSEANNRPVGETPTAVRPPLFASDRVEDLLAVFEERLRLNEFHPPSFSSGAQGAIKTSPGADSTSAITLKGPSSETISTTADAAEPVAEGEGHYGPVSANERLWNIATKVRPDPSIGKDVMMKALLLANPQAFYKSRMDQMKEGAILRIPSLSEIVKHTGSKEAKQLLEQHSTLETTSSKLPTPMSNN